MFRHFGTHRISNRISLIMENFATRPTAPACRCVKGDVTFRGVFGSVCPADVTLGPKSTHSERNCLSTRHASARQKMVALLPWACPGRENKAGGKSPKSE